MCSRPTSLGNRLRDRNIYDPKGLYRIPFTTNLENKTRDMQNVITVGSWLLK